MIVHISKLIVKSIMGLVVILLLVESSMIIPAYFSVVFSTHAIATNGARNNYINEADIELLKKNITLDNTNDRFSSVEITTDVLEVQPEGNTLYKSGDNYGHNLTETLKLQRSDSYVIHVKATYRFLTPKLWGFRTTEERKAGLPITLSYEVPVICLQYIKELD